MQRKRTITLLISVLVGSAILLGMIWAWLFNPVRPQVLFLMDPLYHARYSSPRDRFELQYRFSRDGHTLRIVEIGLELIDDPNRLARSVEASVNDRVRIIVTSPLLTRGITSDKAWFATDALIGGIGTTDDPLFDFLLEKERVDLGWVSAARSLEPVLRGNPLPTALLYDSRDAQAVTDAELFANEFTAGPLERVPIESTSSREAGLVMENLASKGVMLVVVPYLADLDKFIVSMRAEGMRWVVDAPFASVVPPDALEGLIVDDLYASLIPVLEQGRGEIEHSYPLVRKYR